DVSFESGVNESSGRMREQSQTPERTFSLEACRNISGQGNLLVRRAEHEFPRMQNKAFGRIDLYESRELGLIFGGVNHGVLVIVEESKVAIEPHVDARRLHHRGLARRQADATGSEFCVDVTV